MKHLLLTTIAAVLVVGCGESSIHQAAGDGNIEAVKRHLDAGADVNAKDDVGWTPLHSAAYYGHKEIVELLIANGADVNANDRGGSTPLHWAANKEVAELLIDKGADVNAGRSDGGWTPLQAMASGGRKEVAELLIAEGADVNAIDGRGWTPLFNAAHGGRREAVKLLISKGADVNAMIEDGHSPLDEVTHPDNPHAAKKEIADLLRKHGGKTGEELKAEESIHDAAGYGNIEAVQQHLDAGADVNAKTESGRTPLDWAEKVYTPDSPEVKAAKKEIAALLRKHGGKTGAELKAERE